MRTIHAMQCSLLPDYMRLRSNILCNGIDDLLRLATDQAEFCLRDTGNLPPTLWFNGPDGVMVFTCNIFNTVADKNAFAENCRPICAAHAATDAVLVMETWLKE